jgi:hypothetical protein
MSRVGISIKVEVEDPNFYPSISEIYDFLDLHDV